LPGSLNDLREYDTVARADNYFAEYCMLFLRRHSQLFVSHPASIYLYNQFSYPTLSSALKKIFDGVFLLLKTTLFGLKQALSNF
jgi:hypothetical protein